MGGVYVGTSGWTYDDWRGPFYPQEVKGAERLSFYASRFDTVEVNASFYRFPTARMVDAWNRRLSRSFHLVLKGHRQITHRKKLVDCRESLEGFLERALALRTLRVMLWQLPPSIHRDPGKLDSFLEQLRRGVRRLDRFRRRIRHAVEFRHQSWWDDGMAETLARHDACFVTVSHPRLPGEVLATTDFLYVRFHGLGRRLYDYDYSDRELYDWVSRLRAHRRARALYAFFNNDWQANAPRNATRFREMLGVS